MDHLPKRSYSSHHVSFHHTNRIPKKTKIIFTFAHLSRTDMPRQQFSRPITFFQTSVKVKSELSVYKVC